ncbi:hypothetical protein [Bradyrhizobium sp. AZCC 2230]|uniref:hypothetical protein n=1 Tax=Bradyrhizobium sp. AZCC 2230 TaxID=3117021 RepID=UPI002FEED868
MLVIRAMKHIAVPICLLLLSSTAALARDDGRYANSPLKPWFEGLQSEFGKSCEDSDAYVLSEPDWKSDHGQYRVRIDDEWVLVPDGALIKQPNLAGRTMV